MKKHTERGVFFREGVNRSRGPLAAELGLFPMDSSRRFPGYVCSESIEISEYVLAFVAMEKVGIFLNFCGKFEKQQCF